MKKNIFISLALAFGVCCFTTSCEDMLSVDSDRVVYPDDYNLDNAGDTVNGVLGIMRCMQQLADRYVLLGEVRGDLMATNENTETVLKNISNFDYSDNSEYLHVADYYNVINNCNYFIAKVDTNLRRNNSKVFIKEYVAAKSMRAWTYLQLVTNYGKVPFYTNPVLTVADADASKYPMYDVTAVANAMIEDLAPFQDPQQYPLPSWSSGVGLTASNQIPAVRAVLGDCYLWAGKYREAIECYRQMLVDRKLAYSSFKLDPSGTSSLVGARSSFGNELGNLCGNNFNSYENICSFSLSESSSNGTVSKLGDLFNPETAGMNQFTYSPSYKSLNEAQSYTLLASFTATGEPQVLYYNGRDYDNGGDCRYSWFIGSTRSEGITYDGLIEKICSSPGASVRYIKMYRAQLIQLRMAEAINCLEQEGFENAHEVAFKVLTTGLKANNYKLYKDELQTVTIEDGTTKDTIVHIDSVSINFNLALFDNADGVHSRGCGYSSYNTIDYCLDTLVIADYFAKDSADVTHQDFVNYVEDKIVDELALETCFEGNRFTDLVRFAARRGEPAYLAKRIAARGKENVDYGMYEEGFEYDAALYQKLLDTQSWYLPLK